MLAFSLDIDWAPDEIIADTLGLFEAYQVKCTIFATHATDVVLTANPELFELGIHPNFNPLLEGKQDSVDRILDHLLTLYPEAKGIRSHSMTQSTPLLDTFVDKGLLYDVNHFMPYFRGLRPYRLWNGLIKIPYNWEDDIHYLYGKPFTEDGLDIFGNDLNVLNFHPIHVYLNTENQARYDIAKTHYMNAGALRNFQNAGTGTRSFLIRMLEQVKQNQIRAYNLMEVAQSLDA